MKKNRSEKLIPDIDLTSLLDVIFIILMVVMCNVNLNAASSEAAQEAGEEPSEEQISESMKEELLEELSQIEDRVAFVVIYADFDNDDPTLRRVRIQVNGSDEAGFSQIDINADNEDEAYAKLSTYIGRIIEDRPDIPVWFSIDDEQVLYRDYVRINEILSEKRSVSNNMYVSEEAVE